MTTTSSGKGMDVEAAFRAVFHIDPSVDVVELMDAVIDVASAIYPQQQFKKRTHTLVHDLDEIARMRAAAAENNPEEKPDDHDPTCTKAAANNKSCHEEKDNKKKKEVVVAVNEEKKAALELKFENSSRRYQQRLDETRKGKRKIQLLDLKDVPKPKLLRTKSRAKSNRLIRAVR